MRRVKIIKTKPIVYYITINEDSTPGSIAKTEEISRIMTSASQRLFEAAMSYAIHKYVENKGLPTPSDVFEVVLDHQKSSVKKRQEQIYETIMSLIAGEESVHKMTQYECAVYLSRLKQQYETLKELEESIDDEDCNDYL